MTPVHSGETFFLLKGPVLVQRGSLSYSSPSFLNAHGACAPHLNPYMLGYTKVLDWTSFLLYLVSLLNWIYLILDSILLVAMSLLMSFATVVSIT